MFTVQSLHVSFEMWGSVFCFIIALSMFFGRNFETKRRSILMEMQFLTAVLLLMDACAWGFRGNASQTGYYMVRISNFMVFVLSDVVLLLYHLYLCQYLFADTKDTEEKKPLRYKMVIGISIIGICLVVISQFTHLYYYFDAGNLYHRNQMHFLALLIPFIGELLDFSLLLQYRKKVSAATFGCLVSYMILPMVALVILIFFYGIALVNISICISVIFMFVVSTVEQNREMAEKEKEMCDMRIAMTVSQIGPHFIFNTLSSIQYMCRKNPQMAEETVKEFTTYLRGNIDSLTNPKNITFAKELEHVKSYLAIEQKRFGARVQVVYDIRETDFEIPALSLQVLVENAVKHGICKKPEGGTVTIRTERREQNILLTVQDTGVGFDPTKKKTDDKIHAGIENIQTRLKNMCGGKMEICSTPGEGTIVVLTLPVDTVTI